MSTYAEPVLELPDWLDDSGLTAEDRLPAVPSWLVDSPLPSAFLSVPDCPCCCEPDPPAVEPMVWAVPGGVG